MRQRLPGQVGWAELDRSAAAATGALERLLEWQTSRINERTLTQIRTVPGVVDLTLVFGSWDAVVHAEAKTLPSLTRLVVGQIRGIHGVQATETLVAAEL